VAFVEKYRCEWYDRLGLKWRYDILEDGFGGSITDLQASANPLRIDYLANSDDLFENPIHGSKCDLTVKVSTSFALADLYTVQDRKFKVNIYYNTTSLFWTGYIVSNSYSEAYDDTPYDVVISANDGLGYLKEISFEDISSTFDQREITSYIIYIMFFYIGVTEFKEIINIYEDSMDSAAGDSPITQQKIDISIFKDMYCYEVLEHILNQYNAICRQFSGEYYLYRPIELTAATAYGRKFTAATTTIAFTVTPALNINRSGSASDIRDVNGGKKELFPPAKKIIINQDYGWKESWLSTWQFRREDYSSGDWYGWEHVGLTSHTPIGQILPSEKEGILMGYTGSGSVAPDALQNLYQDFAFFALSTSDILVFEFDYLLYNASAATVNDVDIYIKVANGAGTKWLEIDTANLYKWSDTEKFITIRENASPGASSWATFSRRIPGLPTSGKYRVTLYGVDESSNVRVGLRNLKFYCTSDEITAMRTLLMGKRLVTVDLAKFGPFVSKYFSTFERFATIIQREYIVTNSINGKVKYYDRVLGDVADAAIDNVIEQFAGAIGASLESLTAVAASFVTDFAADYLSGGVVVTSSGSALIFEAQVAGVNFTGSTTITNLTGDLDGSVAATTANQAAIWTIELGGASGEINIIVNSISRAATIVTTLDAAAATFLSNYGTAFPGVVVSNPSGAILTFTGGVTSFTIQEVSGDMNATGGKTQDSVKRKDTITLSGSYGTANILCDGTTKVASFKLTASSVWNTRGGSEADPIIELTAAEIAYQFSRPKEMLLSQPIYETGGSSITPHIDFIANFQDSLNTVGGNNRKFVPNQGSFDVKNRKWNIDLIEIIP
jgi:hypothetical protein